jgi:hypothetical protein
MFHARTSIESGGAAAAAVLPLTRDVGLEDVTRQRLAAERAIDDVIADSFPASDPPSWNPGIARLAPLNPERVTRAVSTHGRAAAGAIDVIDVSRPHRERTFLDVMVSVAGAAGIALMVPLVMLLIGLPIVFAIRGLLELFAWGVGFATR